MDPSETRKSPPSVIDGVSESAEPVATGANSLESTLQTLEQRSAALREALGQVEDGKREIAAYMQANLDNVVLPLLGKLRERVSAEDQSTIDLLRQSLGEFTSPFLNHLESKYTDLSPRELGICNMIKSDLTSKEIAATLNVSVETVRCQRKSIRRKLGIANDKVSLASFLKTA